MVRIHSEYVRHVLKGGPGVCRDFAGAVASPAPNLSATGPNLHSERAPHRKASPLAIGELPAQDAILRQRGSRQKKGHGGESVSERWSPDANGCVRGECPAAG